MIQTCDLKLQILMHATRKAIVGTTQDTTMRHLYVLDLVEQQLHEDGHDALLADERAVEPLARQDVQRAHRALHDLLHAHAVRVRAARAAAAHAARHRAALLPRHQRINIDFYNK